MVAALRRVAFLLVTVVLAFGLTRCSSAKSVASLDGVDADAVDAADDVIDAGVDADDGANGHPSDVYPAFKPPVPQARSSSGPVLSTVKVVPVFFTGDALAAQLQDFLTKWLASSAWPAMVGEYGVGAATMGTPVTVTTPPAAKVSDADIRAFLGAMLDGTHPEWPPADGATIYVLYYPDTTTIDSGGDLSCKAFAGYHSELGNVVYAVMPRCAPGSNLPRTWSQVEALTYYTTHEIVEAATDPHPATQPAWNLTTQADNAWSLAFFGGELGDLCQIMPDSPALLAGLPGGLQRTWSNRSIAAYHDPCAPASATDPYFVAVPVLPDTVVATYGLIDHPIRGVRVGMGNTRTIDVQLLSDGPTTGPWTVAAKEFLPAGAKPTLTLALDRTSGQNGEILHLTLTVTAKDGSGASNFLVTSKLGGRTNVWVGSASQ
jgi:hypothetical protein